MDAASDASVDEIVLPTGDYKVFSDLRINVDGGRSLRILAEDNQPVTGATLET